MGRIVVEKESGENRVSFIDSLLLYDSCDVESFLFIIFSVRKYVKIKRKRKSFSRFGGCIVLGELCFFMDEYKRDVSLSRRVAETKRQALRRSHWQKESVIFVRISVDFL